MTAELVVEPLRLEHRTHDFACGKPKLDVFLQRFALASAKSDSARTYVAHRDGVVVGYYCLAAASVEHEAAPERVRKGLARHPIPVILLARLAVDRREQGKGLGSALVKDALLRVASAADRIGARALLVHAKDDDARAFYEHFGFESSATEPLHLFLLMKDLRAWVGRLRR